MSNWKDTEWEHASKSLKHFRITFSKKVKFILLLLETFKNKNVAGKKIKMWQESSLCNIKMIFQQAIRIWRIFLRSVSLMQVVKQNKTTVSVFKFGNANLWYSNSSVLKHMANRPRGEFVHCCVCFYSFKHCGFMQEEIDFCDGNDRWNKMWKNDILDFHMSTV